MPPTALRIKCKHHTEHIRLWRLCPRPTLPSLLSPSTPTLLNHWQFLRVPCPCAPLSSGGKLHLSSLTLPSSTCALFLLIFLKADCRHLLQEIFPDHFIPTWSLVGPAWVLRESLGLTSGNIKLYCDVLVIYSPMKPQTRTILIHLGIYKSTKHTA